MSIKPLSMTAQVEMFLKSLDLISTFPSGIGGRSDVGGGTQDDHHQKAGV
jgi:hypothetical protein